MDKILKVFICPKARISLSPTLGVREWFEAKSCANEMGYTGEVLVNIRVLQMAHAK